MQGYGNDEPFVVAAGEAIFLQGIGEQSAQRSAEMVFASVFESMNQLASESLVPIRADGEIESEIEIRAIPAANVVRHGALVGLSANRTVGRLDAVQFGLAGETEPATPVRSENLIAADTVSRVDEPEGAFDEASG